MLAGHASRCWLSALGAGVPYNREKNESKIICFLAVHIFDIISQPVYRQLVPLREQGSLQPLDKTLALLGKQGENKIQPYFVGFAQKSTLYASHNTL